MDIKIDQSTGKFVIQNNDLVLTTGRDAVAQYLSQVLQTFLGEWFLDTTVGVPWFQKVLGQKNPNIVDIESALKVIIIETPGVQELTSFSFTFDPASRTANVQGSVQSQMGEVLFNEDVGA